MVKEKFYVYNPIVFAADCISFLLVSLALYSLTRIEPQLSFKQMMIQSMILIICTIFYDIVFHTYQSIWIYAGAKEYTDLFLASCCAYGTYLLIAAFLKPHYSVLLFMLTVAIFTFAAQLLTRLAYRHLLGPGKNSAKKRGNTRNIAIIGAGSAGIALYNELKRNPESPYRVWCFLDDDKALIGKRINGIKILGPVNSAADILRNSPVSDIFLAIPTLPEKRKKEILDLCSDLPYYIKILPDCVLSYKDVRQNYASFLRKIKPEDLLERSGVEFDRDELEPHLAGKVVLVTGGGGSIGSELCRQIATYNPSKLIIFDIIENSAYLLKKELDFIYKGSMDVQVEIGTIRDEGRLNELFRKYRPDIVYHAAAHKHVPLMERNPGEAVKNNIFGTYNLLKVSALYGCEKFVMISTDKAVNPTNVMGATKRYCEMMIQAMADIQDCRTEYSAVRFGNVLGSNGSVVPLFMSQIEHGGPITITDKRIIRYFMTISEAASLVLKAGSMARKSEIFILDMGKPAKIVSLAENLVRLAGLKPYTDIQIVETGLRPGEKLYEELLIGEGNTATSMEKIFIEKQNNRVRYTDIEKGIKMLSNALDTENNEIIMATLKKLVPTFKAPEEVNSKVESVFVESSIFERLRASGEDG